jgi:hypothetical protein
MIASIENKREQVVLESIFSSIIQFSLLFAGKNILFNSILSIFPENVTAKSKTLFGAILVFRFIS